MAKTPAFADDAVTFESIADLRIYLKRLHDHYMEQMDRHGVDAGELMRDRMKGEKAGPAETSATDWRKMGSLWVNLDDPTRGLNDVTLKLLADKKAKLAATDDALRSFEEFRQFIIAPGSSFLLYLKDGVPERIVVTRPGTAAQQPKD